MEKGMAKPNRDVIIHEVLAAASGLPIPPGVVHSNPPVPIVMAAAAASNSTSKSSSSMSFGPGGVYSGGSGGVDGGPSSKQQPSKSKPGGMQEFSVRVPKLGRKKHNIMRFNGALNVDFAKWKSLKMQREDNQKAHAPLKFGESDMPKFGAGSEFGRDKREAALRAKYGRYRKKYNPQNQPWQLKLSDGKQNRRFKGMIEGGVNDNASYYVFTHSPEGHFDVFPIQQWINFTPIQTYKALSAEEAEEEFGRRNKIMNLFSVMVRKRMKIDDVDEESGAGDKSKGKGGGKGGGSKGGLKMSEMDDWDDEDDDDDDDGSDGDGDDKKSKKKDKKKKGGEKSKKKKKNDSDDEPVEESDDGDEEGLELDYISDSSEPSEDEDDKKPEMAGVDQEGGGKGGLLDSSSDEEEEEKKKKEDNEEKANKAKGGGDKDKEGGGGGGGGGGGATSAGEKKKKQKKKKELKELFKKDEQSGSSEHEEGMMDSQGGRDGGDSIAGPSAEALDSGAVERSTTAAADKDSSLLKRKFDSIDFENTGGASKKTKLDVSSAVMQTAASEGITEEAVRKYLLRKPMTATELLQKFKSRKAKVSEDMVMVIAQLLKKINPMKRTQNSKLYFYLNN